ECSARADPAADLLERRNTGFRTRAVRQEFQMKTCGPLLSIRLSIGYRDKPAVLRDASFSVERGEIVGLVGESGSGKSSLALAILRLLQLKGGTAHGEIRFNGRDLARLPECEMRTVRGRGIG